MPEYDMPIEEQVKLLVKEFKAFKGSIETRFDSIDGKLDKVQVLLERTHDVAKLGLEGVQGLRESTDEKFAAAAKVNAEQTGLLKSLVVHVRKRVERVEQQPKRRRRT